MARNLLFRIVSSINFERMQYSRMLMYCFCLLSSSIFHLAFNKSGAQTNSIIPPSPQLSHLQGQLDYPVSHTTGIPEISIPLYEIKTGSINLPISISYYATGFKPSFENGDLGLLWSFDAATPITRTIINKPDESSFYPKFRNPTSLNQALINDFTYIGNLNNDNGQILSGADAEYDVFYYKVGATKGKFIFAASDSVGSGKRIAMTVPYEPILVRTNKGDFSNSASPLDLIEITDKSGNIYSYGRSLKDNSIIDEVDDGLYNYRTAWFLTRISTPDSANFIEFKYAPVIRSRSSRTDAFEYTDMAFDYNITDNLDVDQLNDKRKLVQGRFQTRTYISHRLSEILFKEGRLEMTYSNLGLQKIVLKNNSGLIVRTFMFNLEQFKTTVNASSQTKTNFLKLSSLKILNNDSLDVEEYKFDYNEPENLNLSGDLKNTNGIDHWGYYNGKDTNSSLIPPFTLLTTYNSSFPISYNNREVDEDYTKLFILKKIYYPTGGFSEFEFESNRANDKKVGGLRIRSILSKPYYSSSNKVKLFEYGKDNCGNGILMFNPYSLNNYLTLSEYCIPGGSDIELAGTLRHQSVSSSPTYNLGGCPVYYSEVTEYDDSRNGVFTGKTVFNYDSPSLYNLGLIGASSYQTKYDDWRSNHLVTKTVFERDGSVFVPIKKEQFNYFVKNDSIIKCLKMQLKQLVNPNGISSLWGFFQPRHGGPRDYYQLSRFYEGNNLLTIPYQNSNGVVYNIVEYDIFSGAKLVKQKITTNYNRGSQLENVEIYDYCDLHNDPVSISRYTSGNDTIKNFFKYPNDFRSKEPYISMVDRYHILSPVVEFSEFRMNKLGVNTFLKSTKNNFGFWDGNGWSTIPTNNIYVHTVEKRILSNPLEIVTKFNLYDKVGHVLEVEYLNNVKKVYLWGYHNLYPVAEISGIDYNTVSSKISPTQLNSVGSNDSAMRNLLSVLRVIPNAHVNTFTYKGLIGMSSATDTKGLTKYFDYDSLGRLKLVRDNDGRVIKKITYIEAGSKLDSTVMNSPNHIYYSPSLVKKFKRNNCGFGYSSDSISYRLPENKYTSTVSQLDADRKAYDALDSEGQAYANTNSPCTFIGGVVISLINNVNVPSANPIKVQFIKYDSNLVRDVIVSEGVFPVSASDTPGKVVIAPGSYKLKFSFVQTFGVPYGPGFLLGNDIEPDIYEWYDGYNPYGYEYVTQSDVTIDNETTRIEAINSAH